MKKQIQRISVLQNAKMVAALYLLLSLPVLLVMWTIGASFGQVGITTAMMIGVPVGYALGGFVFAAIGAWLYNLVAAVVGGFEFTTREVGAK